MSLACPCLNWVGASPRFTRAPALKVNGTERFRLGGRRKERSHAPGMRKGNLGCCMLRRVRGHFRLPKAVSRAERGGARCLGAPPATRHTETREMRDYS